MSETSREQEVRQYLEAQRNSEPVKRVVELLTMTREKCRDRLEQEEHPESRGRAKLCKDLLKILSE